MPMQFAPVQALIEDIKAGKMIILLDDESRENEGDLVMAANLVRPQDVNFMITHARGLVCLTLTRLQCQALNLPLMVARNQEKFATNFTVSIEASSGVTTGISAADRAHTLQVASAPNARACDVVSPGHIFPLMAKDGGVLVRQGHTEAGCDLVRLAGLPAAAAIVEVIKDDGEMARLPDLAKFALQHGLKMGSIADLIDYRLAHEDLVHSVDGNIFADIAGTRYRACHRAMQVVWGDSDDDTALAILSTPIDDNRIAICHGMAAQIAKKLGITQIILPTQDMRPTISARLKAIWGAQGVLVQNYR